METVRVRLDKRSGRWPVHVTESLRDPDVANAGIPYNMTAFPEHLRGAGYSTHVVGAAPSVG